MAEHTTDGRFSLDSLDFDTKIPSITDWTMIYKYSSDLAQQIQEQAMERIQTISLRINE